MPNSEDPKGLNKHEPESSPTLDPALDTEDLAAPIKGLEADPEGVRLGHGHSITDSRVRDHRPLPRVLVQALIVIFLFPVLLSPGSITQPSAPTNATYVLNTANAKLTNAQVLASLGTGILKVTTGTGILSDAASSDVVGLFTGCSGTQYLGADGACHTATAQTFPAAGIMVSTGSAFGTSLADPLTGTHGGTGVNNGASTITLGGNLTTSGAFNTTLTVTNTTNSTLPAGTHTLAGLDVANTFTATQTLSGAGLIFSGNISAPAWTTNGIRLQGVAATLTDTTSSGTVAAAYTNSQGGNTIAASAATTFTTYYTDYTKDPVAGTNVTFTNKYALGADSLRVVGNARVNSLNWGTTGGPQLTGDGSNASLLNSGNTASTFGPSNIIFKSTDGSGFITFNTANLERVRVHNSGGFSIGNTTDPGAANLSVTGGAAALSLTLTNAVGTTLPFLQAKTTASATAPAAGNCAQRWEVGTNAGTGKLVAYCGTSSTGVTIVDNVGSGF